MSYRAHVAVTRNRLDTTFLPSTAIVIIAVPCCSPPLHHLPPPPYTCLLLLAFDLGAAQGTTNSAVALIVNGTPTMVRNARGKFTTPSVVSYTRKPASAKSSKTKMETSEEADNDSTDSAEITVGKPADEVAPSGGETAGRSSEAWGVVVGAPAVERIPIHPRSTYSSVKRLIGRTVKEAKEAGVSLGALNVDQVRVGTGRALLGVWSGKC